MGNQASKESAKEPHRLSKPKTNTNASTSCSTASASNTDISTSAITAFLETEAEDMVITSPGGHRISRQETRRYLRSRIFGNKPDGSELDSYDQANVAALSADPRDPRAARSRSIDLQRSGVQQSPVIPQTSTAGSQLSLVTDSRVIDLEAAISILQELKKTASPEELVALHKALLPDKPAQPAPVREEHPQPSTDAPIRRRSLAVPGVATRTASVEELHQTSAVPEITIHSPQGRPWNAEMASPFHSMRLNGLSPIEEGRDSPAPRAQTPADMEYSHLGTLKLGSLMITNGAASPEPSIRNLKNQYSFDHGEEGYFTASEGRNSPEDAHEGKADVHGVRASPVEEADHSVATPVKPSPIVMTIGQLRRSTDHEYLDKDFNRRSTYDEKEAVQQLRRSSTIAREYTSEFPDSPYISHFPEDARQPNMYNPESGDMFFHHSDTTFSPEELSVGRDESRCAYTSQELGSPSRASSRRVAGPRAQTTQDDKSMTKLKRPLQAKTDSGYSSVLSLGASQGTDWPEKAARRLTRNGTPKPKDGRGQKLDEGDTGSLYTFEQMLTMPCDEKKSEEHAQPEIAAPKPSRPARPRSKSLTKALRKSLPSLRSSESTPAVPTLESTKSSSPPKKLQKRRPLSYCPIVIQSNRPIQGEMIPGVPDDVEAQFSHRLAMSPGMEHLEHTFPSVSRTDSVESPNSPTQYDVPIRFPSPNPSSRDLENADLDIVRPPIPPQHRSSGSIHRKKPSRSEIEEHEEREIARIADFATVAQSLGGSPYDIAMSTGKVKSPYTAPTHPHQLSASALRSRSADAMDAETAAAMARMRSRDRSVPDFGRTRVSQSRGSFESHHDDQGSDLVRRHSTMSQPRSFDAHRRSQSADTRPINFSRPHSMYDEVPPMPPLPVDRDGWSPGSASSKTSSKDVSPASNRKMPQDSHRAAINPFVETRSRERERVPTERASISLDRPLVSKEESGTRWAAHARLWRERRKSIGDGLLAKSSKPLPLPTPAIVVSRYVTPTLNTSPTAELPADVPTYAPRPASMDMQRPSSISRHSEPSPSYYGHDSRPTYSRASTVASNYSSHTSSSRADSASCYSRPSSTVPTEYSGSSQRSRHGGEHRKSLDTTLLDRYSGGLDYNYEPGVGFSGSAGTRDLRSVASRKSLLTSYQFGIDLSDVPVFLQKTA